MKRQDMSSLRRVVSGHLPQRATIQRGSALIEFALTSTVFFMTMFGITEFGRMIWQYHVTSWAARGGARWVLVHGPSASIKATDAGLQTKVAGIAFGSNVVATMQCGPVGGALGSCDCTVANPVRCVAGNVVSVHVTQGFNRLTNFLPAGTINLSSTAQMTIAR